MGESTHHLDSELLDEVAALRELAKFLVHSQDSDDLVQDTVIVMLTQRDAPRRLGAWLRTVMRNQARARARSEGRRRAREDQLALMHGWFDAGDQLDEELGQRQLIAAMHQSLDELEAPYAELLRARFLEGRTPSEIAAALNCAPATVRWRLHEGLRRLRLRMDDLFEGRTQWLVGVAALLIPLDVEASSGVGTKLHRSQEQHMITASWKFIAAGLAFVGLGIVTLTSLTQASASPLADGVLAPSPAVTSESSSSPSTVALPAVNLASAPADIDDSDSAPTTSGNARLFASAWSSPEWAHCPAMFDPELIDEAIEIGTEFNMPRAC